MSSLDLKEERSSAEPKKKMAKAAALDNNENRKARGENAIAERWDSGVGFLTDVRNEMRKVATPSRDEVRTTTFVVILTVFAFAAYFYVVDLVIGKGLDTMLHKLTSH